MPVQTSYSELRANLASLLDRVTNDHEVVIIRRRGAEDAALVCASELSSLLETAHLLSSPRNAGRLLTAMKRSKSRKLKPEPVSKLRKEFGLEPVRRP